MSKQDVRMIVDLYKYHIIQISGNKAYRFTNNDSRYKLIINFAEKFKKIYNSTFISEDLMRQFIEYQFNYWYRVDSKYGKGTGIQIEWIIGNKALKRWTDRTEKQIKKTDFIIRKNLKADVVFHDVEYDKTRKENSRLLKEIAVGISDVEERDKKLFLNTSKGFANCQMSTTLYNHKSVQCANCKYSESCKELLSVNFRKIYKLRGYESLN